MPHWRLHPQAVAFGVVCVILLFAGLALGRADVGLLGVPFLMGVVWESARTPTNPPRVTIDSARNVHLDDGQDELVRLRFASAGHKPLTVLVLGSVGDFHLTIESQRTGFAPDLIVDWDSTTPLTGRFTALATIKAPPVLTLPTGFGLTAVAESTHLRGLTGPKDSLRPGDGFEFRDVHPMAPGDQFHRLDWRVTARATQEDQFWVKGSYATGETVAVLIMDSRDEVGPDLRTWNDLEPLRVDEPTSLDLARHAAVSIARQLIAQGSRVGLTDLATNTRMLSPAAGERQLRRITYALALSHAVGSPTTRVRPPQIPRDGIVYLFSTLLDDESERLVSMLTVLGHRVIVIDTLPVIRPAARLNLELAWRVTSIERLLRVKRLASRRIPVIAWNGVARHDAPRRLLELTRTDRRRR